MARRLRKMRRGRRRRGARRKRPIAKGSRSSMYQKSRFKSRGGGIRKPTDKEQVKGGISSRISKVSFISLESIRPNVNPHTQTFIGCSMSDFARSDSLVGTTATVSCPQFYLEADRYQSFTIYGIKLEVFERQKLISLTSKGVTVVDTITTEGMKFQAQPGFSLTQLTGPDYNSSIPANQLSPIPDFLNVPVLEESAATRATARPFNLSCSVKTQTRDLTHNQMKKVYSRYTKCPLPTVAKHIGVNKLARTLTNQFNVIPTITYGQADFSIVCCVPYLLYYDGVGNTANALDYWVRRTAYIKFFEKKPLDWCEYPRYFRPLEPAHRVILHDESIVAPAASDPGNAVSVEPLPTLVDCTYVCPPP